MYCTSLLSNEYFCNSIIVFYYANAFIAVVVESNDDISHVRGRVLLLYYCMWSNRNYYKTVQHYFL